jgi:hypothetical protein
VGQPIAGAPQAKDAGARPASDEASDAPGTSPAAKLDRSETSQAAKGAGPAASRIGPPAPKLGDLGSVVPGRRDTAGLPSIPEGEPSRSGTSESQVLSPPLAGPLLGEPTRAPAASGPVPEVPGADALRRLIAGVIPPSAHPSVTPSAKAAEAAPAPATARTDTASAPGAGPKPTPEVKEVRAGPAIEPAAAKTADVVAPEPSAVSTPEPAVAEAPPSAPAPTPAAAAPAPLARAEAPAPAPAANAATAMGGKTMDETVIELLRPLLRDWLDANMPRLIEPALRAEIEALRKVAAKDEKA